MKRRFEAEPVDGCLRHFLFSPSSCEYGGFPALAFLRIQTVQIMYIKYTYIKLSDCIRHLNNIQPYCFRAWSVWTSSSSPRLLPNVFLLGEFSHPITQMIFSSKACAKALGKVPLPIIRRSLGACTVVRIFFLLALKSPQIYWDLVELNT